MFTPTNRTRDQFFVSDAGDIHYYDSCYLTHVPIGLIL